MRVARSKEGTRLALFTPPSSYHTAHPHLDSSHRAQKRSLHPPVEQHNTVTLAKLKESPSGMEPPSPSKFPLSPAMPVFAVSPERAATAQSPSLPDLRTSPLRRHRRNDSDVSVQGLAAMFENLEVKDFKEAQAKYMQALQRQKTKHAAEIRQMEKEHALGMSRRQVRIEELESELDRWKENHGDCKEKAVWDAARKEQREAITKWENAMKDSEEKRLQMHNKIVGRPVAGP